MRIALTRPVSDAIVRCELTHLVREPIDPATARAQHAAYGATLASLGCRLVQLPDLPDQPDGVFVEDAAVVLDEVAVITHPGAPARRPETASVAETLARYRPLTWIQPPATLDGGDVLVAGRTILVGLSSRTGEAGVEQMRRIAEPFGYEVRGMPVDGCLHLKSAVTCVSDVAVLVNPDWVDASSLARFETIEVDPAEPAAGNALRIGNVLLYATAFPRTRERLEQRGFEVRAVDMTELARAEGGVTCCSIVFDL